MRARRPAPGIDDQLGSIHRYEGELSNRRATWWRRKRAQRALERLNADLFARLAGHPDVPWVAVRTDHVWH